MKQLLITVLFVLSLSVLNAQQTESKDKEVENIWSVSYYNLRGLSGGYEMKIAPEMTLNLEAGALISFDFGKNQQKDAYALTPLIKTNVIYYYNFKKRAKKGKNTKHNAGNYLTIGAEMLPAVHYLSNRKTGIYKTTALYGAWGLRRNLGKNFTFQTEVGLGGLSKNDNNNNWYTVFVLDVKLSYNF